MTRPRKRPTSADVAREAGVSQTTVSFVLNNRPDRAIPEATRQRVLAAAGKLNYRLNASARSLAAGRSDVVLLHVPDVPMGPGITRFIESLASALAEHGLTLVTHLQGAHGRALPDVCASVGASAVVGFVAFPPEVVEALHRAGADAVVPSGPSGEFVMDPVGRLQGEHLIGRGHRSLGFVRPAIPALGPMADERLAGVREACRAARLAPPVVVTASLDAASGAEAVASLAADGVTGVCAFNDETAFAVLAGMRERGLAAPGDMAVIGVDDIPTAALAVPPLTSIRFHLDDVVHRRVHRLVTQLKGVAPEAGRSRIDAEIVLRAST
nr:LacI family DNA-binding transcriptional regulator [Yinghuangia sp. ASG 101]